jgi:hypothetical protein
VQTIPTNFLVAEGALLPGGIVPTWTGFGAGGNTFVTGSVGLDWQSQAATVVATPVFTSFTFTPEPATLALLACGAGAVLSRRRSGRKA